MKVNLDFSWYKGRTRLREWWPHVKEHLITLMTAHNTLEDIHEADKKALEAADDSLATRIKQEETTRAGEVQTLSQKISKETLDRQNADTAPGERIDSEAAARKQADDGLATRIEQERTTRTGEVQQLAQNIREETLNRQNAYAALDRRLKPVEEKAHTHDNQSVLDAIDEDSLRRWDAIAGGTVTLGEYLEHVADSQRQFTMLWGLLGMNVYDGGIFGMAQIDEPLDGGDFDDTELASLDCGGFEPFTVSLGTIGERVDGGEY